MTVTGTHRRGWGKADIKRVAIDDRLAILKDYTDKSWLVRCFGRWQLRRELRALRRLHGIQGIPEVLGEVPPCGLMLEPIKGERISRMHRRPPEDIMRMFQRLDAIVEMMHDRGIVHLDLRKRDNILIAADGSPAIIDFNASLRFRPGGMAARLFLPILRPIDTSAVLKWKSFLIPDALTTEERRRHRRMSLLRRLWIFN